MYISYNAELGGNTRVFSIPREFLIKLTHCLRFGLWKILVRFFWFFFFGCCFACSSFLVFITYSLNARGAIETNDLYGKCLSYMLGGIKNMYFYKLLVFLHIFIFAFIFLFYFYFLLFVARYGTVNTRFSLLPSDFYDFLFAPHRLLTTVPHSFQSIVVHRLLPRCCCCSCCCCWDFPVCFCCLQTERCLRRQSVGGHVRNYTEKCGNASKFHL